MRTLLLILISCSLYSCGTIREHFVKSALEKGEVYDSYVRITDTIYQAPIKQVDTLVQIEHDTTIIELEAAEITVVKRDTVYEVRYKTKKGTIPIKCPDISSFLRTIDSLKKEHDRDFGQVQYLKNKMKGYEKTGEKIEPWYYDYPKKTLMGLGILFILLVVLYAISKIWKFPLMK